MVNIQTILASNTLLSDPSTLSSQSGLTFVFAGATAGIGLSTLKAFAKHTSNPDVPQATAYIIGRSRGKFQAHLDELEKINPRGRWVFLEGQLTLLKEGKRLADEIIRQVEQQEGGGKIDALVTSMGYLTFNGQREDTEEGIDADMALQYYNRLLLTQMLLPLLAKSPNGRVVTVFSAGQEAAFTPSELTSEFRHNFSRIGSTLRLSALTTLSFEQLALQYPNVGFVHSHPGGVQTGLLDKLFDTATGIWIYPAGFVKRFITPIFWFISRPFTIPIEESGERHLFLATSSAYPSATALEKKLDGRAGAVPLVQGVEVKRCTLVGDGGKGVYRTQASCETLADKKTLQDLRKQGLDRLGWRETGKVFERVLGENAVRGL